MPNIKTISDGGPNPNTPSVKEMRASQLAGSTGKGTNAQTYGQMQGDFNMGMGEDADDDRASSSDAGEEYDLAGIL